MDFEDQLTEIRNSNVKQYFLNRNLLKFITTHINIENLYNNNISNNNNNDNNDNIIDIFNKMDKCVEDDKIKNGINNIKTQIIKELSNLKDNKNEEKKLCNILIELLPSTEINNCADNFNFKKILELKHINKPNILIYSGNSDSDNHMTQKQVDLFYEINEKEFTCAILCNADYGIVNKNDFEIDIQNSVIYIFIPNHNYNENLFKTAIDIIYHLYDIIKDSDGIIEIDKELLQRLKLEYNYFLITHTKHINLIKGNIISLEKLALNQLDHFFKRTHINSNDKPYSCQLCGTKFGTDKSLKTHLKLKHQIQLFNKKNKKH